MNPVFKHKGESYPADGVIAVKPVDESTVEVRFATRGPVILHETTPDEVLAKIESAKFPTDSA